MKWQPYWSPMTRATFLACFLLVLCVFIFSCYNGHPVTEPRVLDENAMGRWRSEAVQTMPSGGVIDFELNLTPDDFTLTSVCRYPDNQEVRATVTSPAKIGNGIMKILEAQKAENSQTVSARSQVTTAVVGKPVPAPTVATEDAKRNCQVSMTPGSLRYFYEEDQLVIRNLKPGKLLKFKRL